MWTHRGREVFQPGELVALCAFAHHNAILMLQSGIGEPYNPETRTGHGGTQLHLSDYDRR